MFDRRGHHEADPASLAVIVLVAVGAFAGAGLRHAVGLVVAGLGGTLTANVLGCVLLGALLSEATAELPHGRAVRLLLGTGLVSSFTTYSTFALEAATIAPSTSMAYVLASYGLGLAGVLVGRRAGTRWAGASG